MSQVSLNPQTLITHIDNANNSYRDRRPLHGEPHGDALAASLLTSVSSLDQLGRIRILG